MLSKDINSRRFSLRLSILAVLAISPVAALFFQVVESTFNVDRWVLGWIVLTLSPLVGPLTTKGVAALEDLVRELDVSIMQWGTTIRTPREKLHYVAKCFALLVIASLATIVVITRAPESLLTTADAWKQVLLFAGVIELAIIASAIMVATGIRLLTRTGFVE